MTQSEHTIRRGLPRTPGGQAWPVVIDAAPTADSATATTLNELAVESVAVTPPTALSAATPVAAAADETASVPSDVAAVVVADGIRRGLPRVSGGAPWPPAKPGIEASAGERAEPPVTAERITSHADVGAADVGAAALPAAESPRHGQVVTGVTPAASTTPVDPAVPVTSAVSAPSNSQSVRTAAATPPPVTSQAAPATPAANPVTALSTRQRVGVGTVGAFALFGFAAAIVLLSRWLVGFEGVSAFIARYPGEYELPHSAPVGLPAWLGWQHFFNLFFLVLIVRTGLQVRHQQRPPAYWASKRNPQQKISLMLWFHQSLDVLWLVNGAIFVILLFTTGQWMRIVPTSWEVFPNALSAGLQYLTLNWPVENGWINYNSLQQLAYFGTVFIAAPLAVASGVRLSGFWPKDNLKLSAAYPIEVARALHFPVMLYFVGFTVIHVVLVLTTGALRNLNHMYGARDEVSWYGALMLLISLAVIAGAFIAARPMVLAPIARTMGKVSAR